MTIRRKLFFALLISLSFLFPGFPAASAIVGAGVLHSPQMSLKSMLEDFRTGQYDRAAARLDQYLKKNPLPEDAGEASLLLGLVQRKREDLESALEAFRLAESNLPILSDFCAHLQTRSLESMGRHEEAAEQLSRAAKFYKGSPFFSPVKVQESLARLETLRGLFDRATRRYERLAGSNLESGTYTKNLFNAGMQAELGGSVEKAMASYRKILDAARVDGFTIRALERYHLLTWTRAKERYPGKFRYFLKNYADEHYKESNYRPAQAAYEILALARRSGLSPGDEYRLGMSAFFNHDNDKAHEVFTKISALQGFSKADASLFRLAKLATRMGDNAASRRHFAKLGKRSSSGPYKGRIAYQIALLDLEENKYKEAFRYFRNKANAKSGNRREYLLWLAAWTAYRSGNPQTAMRHFQRLIDEFSKSRDRDRYLYWRGRLHRERKENALAVRDWKQVAGGPRSHYGMLAIKNLKESGVKTRDTIEYFSRLGNGPPSSAMSLLSSSPGLGERAQRFNLLKMYGLDGPASLIAARVARALQNSSPKIVFQAVPLLQKGGQYHRIKRLARKNGLYAYCKGLAAPLWTTYWPLIYPQAYPELIGRYAKERNIPRNLINALIYNESNHHPEVVSPAGAIGLMQIVPRTGRQIAEELGDRDFRPEDLRDPKINIRYGTWYLRHLLDLFNGNEICALAAYNAGPLVAGKWCAAKKDLPPEYFMEEITYKETNRYVKKVLATKKIYQILHGP